MFRTAQLRRQLHNHPIGDLNNLLNPAINPDIVTNVNALGLRRNDIQSYLTRPQRHGEHKAGFVTRALFSSRHGQTLRNAMTDDSGFKMGRFLIRDNFNRVVHAANTAGAVLTARQRAQITARIHNSGAGNLNNYVNHPANAVNAYVNRVMAHWVP